MKKLILLLLLTTGSAIFYSRAQVRVNVGVNIGSQPDWGPSGYDYAEYYYMPDMDVYYDVPQRQFIYLQGNRWMFAASLPPAYQRYDLYHCYKVVINEPRPYERCDVYRARYAPYRGRRDQVIIRERHDNGNHYGWRKKGKHGKGKGHDKWYDD